MTRMTLTPRTESSGPGPQTYRQRMSAHSSPVWTSSTSKSLVVSSMSAFHELNDAS